MKIICKVNALAWRIKKAGFTWSEAMKAAWKSIKLKEKMHTNIVRITYEKADGTTTTRVATLRPEFLPVFAQKSRGVVRRKVSPKIAFWSITDDGWRSFLPQNLLSIDQVTTVKQLVTNLVRAAA